MTGQHCIAHAIAAPWGATKGKYAVDTDGPSGEPPAECEIVPVDHRMCQTAAQAKEKLEFIDQEIKATRRALVAKVGSGQPP